MLLTGGGEDGRASVKRWRIKVGKKKETSECLSELWVGGRAGGLFVGPPGGSREG